MIKERVVPVSKANRLSGKAVFSSLPYPMLMVSLFVTTMMIQLANGSVSPILTLFISNLSGSSDNIAFISGVIAAVPGVSALLAAPKLGKLGDRIGAHRVLIAALVFCFVLFCFMATITTPTQLGILRFLLGFGDGALMPAVQALLVKYCSDQVTGRIFGYNQSFMYLGNVAGPLIGSGVSAVLGFRWVFLVTAVLVLFNAGQVWWSFKKCRLECG